MRNMTSSDTAEYLVYSASIVKRPANIKSLILFRFNPTKKKKIEAVKKKRKVASVSPDFEKKRKNSVVMKIMTAYSPSAFEYNFVAK